MKVQLFILVVTLLSLQTVQSQNLDYDRKKGKQYADMVKQQMGVYDSDEMNNYVRRIGNRLVSNLDERKFNFEFNIVEESAPNAFALPGGYVFVTTGIIPILQTEDELAGILAHEIIHSNNRHSVKQMKKGIFPTIMAVPGAVVGVLNETMGSALMAPSQLMIAGYSRKYETEADEEGVALAAKAGYDPHALKDALTRLNKVIESITGEKEEKDYFADHPYTPDRVASINAIIEGLTYTKKTGEEDNFLQVFDGTLFGKNPKNGIIRGQEIYNPSLDLYIEFPEKWKVALDQNRMAAVTPNQSAAIIFTLETEYDNIDGAMNHLTSNLPEQYRYNSMTDSYKRNDGNTGKMLVLRDMGSYGMVFAHIIWMPHKDKILKIVSISSKQELEALNTCVKSSRTLKKEERDQIKVKYCHVVKSTGESLEELAKKNNNQVDLQLIKVINDLEEGNPEAGQQVKVISEKVY